jgi:hypothetical protein
MSLAALNRRMLDYQLARGPVTVQVISPWRGCGYFSSAEEVLALFDVLDVQEISAIYTGLNPCPGPHGFRREAAVWPTNAMIPRRRRILTEVDSIRPPGVSATDAEVTAAGKVMDSVQSYLFGAGLSRAGTARALSGNGHHLNIFVDWPCDERSDDAVSGLLKGLAARFSTAEAGIDVTVSDRRRITKMYGCMTRKQASADRPWRWSTVIAMPELAAIQLVSLETIEQIVADLGDSLPKIERGDGVPCPQSVEKFIRRFSLFAERVGIDVTDVRTRADGKVLILTTPCALYGDHGGGVGITADGVRCVQCFHTRCASLGWSRWKVEVEKLHGPMNLDGGITWGK